MFANVTLYSSGEHPAVGVPKQALIYEGDQVRLWVAHDDKSIELRQVKTGLINGDLVEVDGNLKAGRADRYKGQPVHRPRGVRQLKRWQPIPLPLKAPV